MFIILSILMIIIGILISFAIKSYQKSNQEIFYTPSVGYTMADGGEKLAKKIKNIG